MGEYINKYENAAAIQSAVDNGELIKPYVALDENTGMIDWNSKSIDYLSMPLTFEILSDGVIYWKTHSEYGSTPVSIEYKKNNGEWITISSSFSSTTINVTNGDIVQFRGNNARYASTLNTNYSSFENSTCQFNVYGNIMSMINSTNYSELTSFSIERPFPNFFRSCTGLTDASNLILPATTLASNCYSYMFSYCTSLTTAPQLPATTLASNCYSYMFNNCRSLNYIKCLATDISASNCTYVWTSGVSSTGTFVTPSTTAWSTGTSGIPKNWTRVDA